MRPADGLIIDLDGTLYQGDAAIPGAANALSRIRQAGLPMRFATNTTRFPRSEMVLRLKGLGIHIDSEDLFTAPMAAAGWLAEQGARRVSLLLPEATFSEFANFELDHQNPDHVVVGDLGDGWTFAVLDQAMKALLDGACLIAIHKNRWWDPGSGPRLDAGAFVAALEFASDSQALLVGKPSAPFFHTAAADLHLPLNRIAVVGDSLTNDVFGPQEIGCLGVAVRTGTFRPEALAADHRQPDAVLDSIADLPAWLGLSK